MTAWGWEQQGWKDRIGKVWAERVQGFWRNDEDVLKLTVMTVAHISEHTKNHWIVQFKWENCMLGELFFKKAGFLSATERG